MYSYLQNVIIFNDRILLGISICYLRCCFSVLSLFVSTIVALTPFLSDFLC